ncbi:MAG: hypothetical protein GY754_35050 [bacterium]|nr:hypothetical protein [bacterium]
MKRSLVFCLIIIMGIAFSIACGGKKIGGQVKGESFKTEGWVDKNTYRLASSAMATRTITNKVARRESAKRAAILNAQYQILEKFKGSTIEGAAGMSSFEMTGMAVAQEVKGTVKGGSVRKVTYDEEDNCEIIYEVKGKNLKGKVSAAEWK